MIDTMLMLCLRGELSSLAWNEPNSNLVLGSLTRINKIHVEFALQQALYIYIHAFLMLLLLFLLLLSFNFCFTWAIWPMQIRWNNNKKKTCSSLILIIDFRCTSQFAAAILVVSFNVYLNRNNLNQIFYSAFLGAHKTQLTM